MCALLQDARQISCLHVCLDEQLNGSVATKSSSDMLLASLHNRFHTGLHQIFEFLIPLQISMIVVQ